MNPSIVSVEYSRKVVDDADPDLSYLQDTASNYEGCTPDEISTYVAQDKARLEAYHSGDWHMVGIKAVAKITVTRAGCSMHYTLESAGLWGVESDSGDDSFEEVYRDELSTLRADIEALRKCEVLS